MHHAVAVKRSTGRESPCLAMPACLRCARPCSSVSILAAEAMACKQPAWDMTGTGLGLLGVP